MLDNSGWHDVDKLTFLMLEAAAAEVDDFDGAFVWPSKKYVLQK